MKIHATMCLLVVLLCGVRLSARAQEEKKDAGAITYEGRVIDRTSGEPIEGAVVKIIRSQYPDTKNRIETTEHKTDRAGKYRFTLPPEQATEPTLYLEAEAEHARYLPVNRGGYSHAMIRKNLDLGDPPFFAEIKMSPGESVTATVVDPDGMPMANLPVSVFTKAGNEAEPSFSDYGLSAFQDTTTDARGQFEILAPTRGDGVIWIYPKDFSPVGKRIGGWRGALSRIMLSPGSRLKGRVLNADGAPVSKVGVRVYSMGGSNDAERFAVSVGGGSGIYRGTMTDAEGNFELNPLPPGPYMVNIQSYASDPAERPENAPKVLEVLPDVFLSTRVEINKLHPDPIEIRAVPTITIRGRFFDAEGTPRTGHDQFFFGKVDGKSFSVKSNKPGTDGWFELKAPKGMRDVRWHLSIHEHGALRWRRSRDTPLTYGDIVINDLQEDWLSLEIVRYEAPKLLVKVVDDQGKPIGDAKPVGHYKTRPDTEQPSNVRFVGGMRGDVGFENQADGRWRSSCMLPDEETTVQFHLEGYQCEPQTVSLKEGETKELVFRMRRL